MKFENVRVMNFENALRGMRNPKESYSLSDSAFGSTYADHDDYILRNVCQEWAEYILNKSEFNEDYEFNLKELTQMTEQWFMKNSIIYKDDDYFEYALIGPKDMKLAQQLISAGSEHRKFMRQIFVSVDITAPLYWWKEFDTYKVGTVANSTSTMHTIQNKEITLDLFEIDDYENTLDLIDDVPIGLRVDSFINDLEQLRQKFIMTGDKRYWKELIRWLPESWLQTRTVTMNYENLLGMCSAGQRRNHKLTEWSGKDIATPSFIDFARSLPYAKELLFLDEFGKDASYPQVEFY